jgi:hypothetical protein
MQLNLTAVVHMSTRQVVLLVAGRCCWFLAPVQREINTLLGWELVPFLSYNALDVHILSSDPIG